MKKSMPGKVTVTALFKQLKATIVRMANNKTEVISAFRGLNRQKTGDGGEFYVAQNVSADDYPCLSSIKSPKKIMPLDEDGNAITNIRIT